MVSILVADDAFGLRFLLRRVLEPPHQVIDAADGTQAMAEMIEHRPSIAILDVFMPGMSGFEVCRAIRKDPSLTSTGVIIMTANGGPTDRAEALEAGADYFLVKPFSPSRVMELVEILIAQQAVHAAAPLVRLDPAPPEPKKPRRLPHTQAG